MKQTLAILTLVLGSILAAAQTPTTVTLTAKETAMLVQSNASIQQAQATVANEQKYLAAAQAKNQAPQVAVLTKVLAQWQATVTQRQTALTKREGWMCRKYKLAAGSTFSADFTSVTGLPAPPSTVKTKAS